MQRLLLNECSFSFYYYYFCLLLLRFFFIDLFICWFARTYSECVYRNKLGPVPRTTTTKPQRNDTDLFKSSHKASNIHLNTQFCISICFVYLILSSRYLNHLRKQVRLYFNVICNLFYNTKTRREREKKTHSHTYFNDDFFLASFFVGNKRW